MTDETPGTGPDEQPEIINATGPSNAAEQVTVTREFANNVEAFDAKERESIAAQTAPNPTTDADLAREAYGDDWNKRRKPKQIAESEQGDPIYAHGGVAVDTAGHALGHASDPERAAALKSSLGGGPDAARYPVTAEAVANDDEQSRTGTSAKTPAAKTAAAAKPKPAKS